jgi:C-3',4' desaturase CrtD
MPDDTVDFAVAGAGFGGLAAAALLARRGFKVGVLEATGLPGGCAQTFRRGPFRFDAGATTVVGLEDDLPLGRLRRALGLDLALERVDPAMTVWLDETRIDRHTDREAWIDEAERRFGSGQRRLWNDIFRTADRGWRLSRRATRFPPAGPGDWARTIADAFPEGLYLLPSLLCSTAHRVRSRLGAPSRSFERFVDEQLLITAQACAARVPFAVGALGLSYTNLGNYAAIGGVGAIAGKLVESIRGDGGWVRFGRRVDAIERAGDGYRVRTRRGDVAARGVVSNLTVWDLAEIGAGEIGGHFRALAARARDAWGAFTLYLGVRDTFGGDAVLHHQVIFEEPLPIVGGRSAFVSLSPRGDTSRAPEGTRAVTVSVHTPTDLWWSLERERYDEVREMIADAVLERIAAHSGLGRFEVEARLIGTPRTFVRYTHRARGRVGGIPSTFSALLRALPPVTPFPNLYLVGDTVYPGQGIPAVVLGALNVADRIGGPGAG